MSQPEIEHEIREIRQWLDANRAATGDRDLLLHALRRLESHYVGIAPGLPTGRDEFTDRFNREFRSVLHVLAEPGAPGGRVTAERLSWLFTPTQREKLADFFVTRRIPERLFAGADDIGNVNAQQRILISAHIITRGTYRPGRFEQRVHARYCGNWAQIVHQYAGVVPSSGPWPEGVAGRGVMGSFDPMGVPVFGAGRAQPVFGGVRSDELEIPEETGHAETAQREEERLARDPNARRRVHRRTQFGMDRFGELRAGDWLYLYNANRSRTGQHSVIFSRWEGEVMYRGGDIPYRIAIVFNQPTPQSGGREQRVLLGDDFSPGQRGNRQQGIPYLAPILAVTAVTRVATTARPASTPAEMLPSPSGALARRVVAANARYIRIQERQLRSPVDRGALMNWLRGENTRLSAALGAQVNARERALLAEANGSDQLEALVRLCQRLRALVANAAAAEQSRRRTFDARLARRRAQAQIRLDEQRGRSGAQLVTLRGQLDETQARITQLEQSPTDRQVRELQAALHTLSGRVRRSRSHERTELQEKTRQLQAQLRGLRRQLNTERNELRRLRRQVASLQGRETRIERDLATAEGRLPVGLVPGPRGEDPGIVTGRLQDLRPPLRWADFVQRTPVPD